MSQYNETLSHTWDLTTPDSGLWINDELTRIMGNFIAIVGNGGAAPTNTMQQLYTALVALQNRWSADIGVVKMYGGFTLPANHLWCDGAGYLRSSYTGLFGNLTSTIDAIT